ncbi:MAG: hypothetical protein KJ601_07845 [Nanoarchaeota archaeon]|nr:hypothetical protein [Nanoarchaeota archaeon]MBU1703732.1 hypothetical protein [Nanoarchaeota archaeon]
MENNALFVGNRKSNPSIPNKKNNRKLIIILILFVFAIGFLSLILRVSFGTAMISIVFLISGFFIFKGGFIIKHKYQLIMDIPTSKIRSLAMGIVEISGIVSSNQLIKTPLSNKKCVFYEYSRFNMRNVVDSSINRKEIENYQDLIDQARSYVNFIVSDQTGRILVLPKDAQLSIKAKNAYIQTKGNTLELLRKLRTPGAQIDFQEFGLKTVDPSKVSENNDQKVFYEHYIEPNEFVYIMGTAAQSTVKGSGVVIECGVNDPFFIISDISEKATLKNLLKNVTASFIIGTVLMIIGLIVFFLSLASAGISLNT